MQVNPSRSQLLLWLLTFSSAFAFLGARAYMQAKGNLTGFAYVGYDDAYISFRYLERFREGLGYNFSTLDSTSAASALGVNILAFLGSLVGGSPIASITALSWVSLGLTGVVLASSAVAVQPPCPFGTFTDRELEQDGLERIVLQFLPATIAVATWAYFMNDGLLQYWSFSGMETVIWNSMIATAVIRVAVTCFSRPLRGPAVRRERPSSGELIGLNNESHGLFGQPQTQKARSRLSDLLWAVFFVFLGVFRIDSIVFLLITAVALALTLVISNSVRVGSSNGTSERRISLRTSFWQSWGDLPGSRSLFWWSFGSVFGLLFNRLLFGEWLGNPRIHKSNTFYYHRELSEGIRTSIDALQAGAGFALYLGALGYLTALVWTRVADPLYFRVLLFVGAFGVGTFAYTSSMPRSDYFRYENVNLFAFWILVVFIWTGLVRCGYVFFGRMRSVTLYERQNGNKPSNFVSLKSGRSRLVVAAISVAVLSSTILMSPRSSGLVDSSRWSWYVQEARLEAASWAKDFVGDGDIVLSSDIGAVSYSLAQSEFLDASGLTSESILKALLNGAEYSRSFPEEPLYLIDSGDGDGTTGSESIWNNPGAYFSVEGAYSRCRFEEVFERVLLRRFPSQSGLPIYVYVYRLEQSTLDPCG